MATIVLVKSLLGVCVIDKRDGVIYRIDNSLKEYDVISFDEAEEELRIRRGENLIWRQFYLLAYQQEVKRVNMSMKRFVIGRDVLNKNLAAYKLHVGEYAMQ